MNTDFKQKLQEKEFLALKDHPRVALKWATGCGKSKMTIDLINYVVDKLNKKVVKVLFVVAERAHIKNWQEEMEKWHLKIDKVATDVICYNSLHKVKDVNYDIIVFDEAHHACTDKRLAILEAFSAPYVYLLSATLSHTKLSAIEDVFGHFMVSTVTLKTAIQKDILPDPKVYIIGMNLDDTVSDQYIRIGNNKNARTIKWEDRSKYIRNHVSCFIQCTALQKYQYLTAKMEYWKERYKLSHNNFHHTQWVNIGSQRKRFLGELKTAQVKKLIDSLSPDQRYVCFCASVAQAKELQEESTISSQRTSKINQAIIDAFNQKQINNLYAVGMITEGMNLNDIQVGIIVQLDGKERLFVQKFGRALRAEDPVSYIFYYRNTQDEMYLRNALENIDKKFIKYIAL